MTRDITFWLQMLRRQAWLVALLTVLGGLTAWIATSQMPKTYTATAKSYVSFANERAAVDPLSGEPVAPDSSLISSASVVQARLTDYAALAVTPLILRPVEDELDPDLGVTLGQLKSSVTVTRVEGQTSLLATTAKASDPDAAAAIANKVAEVMGRAVETIETPSGAGSSLLQVTLVEPAIAPSNPTGPDTTRNLLLGLTLGAMIGVIAAFLREILDRTVKTTEALETAIEAPGLGSIPLDSGAKETPLVPSGGAAARAEAFRNLRTNLQYINPDNPPKVIAVVSSRPQEGKSTTMANLALTMGLAGSRVIVIESDLRRPKMAEYFGVSGDIGLAEVLAGKVDWRDTITSWNRGMVDVVGAGGKAPNPTELLGANSMATMLAEMREEYDYVLLDTAPVGLTPDATVVAGRCDGVIIVVRDGKTTTQDAKAVRNAMEAIHATVLGGVITFRPARRRDDGYGYGYGYGYGSKGNSYANRGIVYEEEDFVTVEGEGALVPEPGDDSLVGAMPNSEAPESDSK